MPEIGQIKCQSNVKKLSEGICVCDFEGNPESPSYNWLLFGIASGMLEETPKEQKNNIGLSRFVIEDCESFDGFFKQQNALKSPAPHDMKNFMKQ